MRTSLTASLCALLVAAGCSGGKARLGGAAGTTGAAGAAGMSGTPDGGAAGTPGELDPGAAVELTVPATRIAALTALQTQLDDHAPTDAASFAARWKPAHASTLGYAPLEAHGVDLLQASHLKLNAGELAALDARGFTISGRQAFPTFFAGYKAIYTDDLPLFISADSILHVVHRSYDAILKDTESGMLVQSIDELLDAMHRALAVGDANDLPATARADADLLLTVARRLLQPSYESATPIRPVAGAPADLVDTIVTKALEANGLGELPLFGDPKRVIDFSQFKPRGHYEDDPQLQSYFRAMIWLGRTDLRFIVHDPFDGGKPHFVRRQFEAALALAALLDSARRTAWTGVDEVLRGFVGESDNMTVLDLDRLRGALSAPSFAALAAHTDRELAQAITDGDFGVQRIASQVLFVPPGGANAPLDRAFLFFGQRYVLDSEVLSNVVFDRVLPGSGQRRMLPDPLDVAFAALGNTHAAPLLAGGMGTYQNYPGALHRARLLADAHEPAFWGGSLYTAWLGALRAMSPPADLTGAAAQGLPAVAKTEAWSRRVLGTQLASWAELRHDTLLYAKQSYSSYPACEYPDAYVDPYPELWKALGRYAARGMALAARVPSGGRATTHFATLATVAWRLEDMARRQLTGQPFTDEQLAWVNQAVTTREKVVGCVTLQVPEGWYVDLFYAPDDVTKTSPTIADIHTNPRDAEVLHVGTGVPRLMVVTAETCVGPRAYVGLASSYYETVTTDLQRLSDSDWAAKLISAPAPLEPAWTKDLVQR